MATQSVNVYEEDMLSQTKRELAGAVQTSAEALHEAAVAAVSPVTETVREVFYSEPIAKSYALGVFTGFALIELSKLIERLVR